MKQTIRNQILIVFFLPLLMAIVHIAFAFPIVTKLLSVLNLINVPLFLICTIVSVMIFGLIYTIVYFLTEENVLQNCSHGYMKKGK